MSTTDVNIVHNFTLMPDDRLLLSMQRSLPTNPYSSENLIRLLSDGSIDNTFQVPDTDGDYYKPIVRSNGKVVVIGEFYTFNGEYSAGNIIELNDDGSFNKVLASADHSTDEIMEDSHGDVFVSGSWKSVNSQPLPWIVKIKPDNTIDGSFKVDASTTGRTYYIGVGVQSGGRLLMGSGYMVTGVACRKSITGNGGIF